MRKFDGRLPEVHIEVVTTTFVASGVPEGIHDLGRFLEILNNPALSRHVELREPAIRPLYRAQAHMQLDAPLLVRRDEIVFANFEGPYFTRGAVKATQAAAPALLMAPPFQIQGTVSIAPGADVTQALRTAVQGFFVVRHARVFDAEGNALGDGDQIIVNGAMVQMSCATRRHVEAATPRPATQPRARTEETADAGEPEQAAARAA